MMMNNLLEEYNVILDGLKSCLMSSGPNVLTIEVIHKKLNHWNEKSKTGMKKRKQKKAPPAYGKHFKNRYTKCGKYGNKLTDPKLLEYAILRYIMRAYVLRVHCEVQYGVDIEQNHRHVSEERPYFLKIDSIQRGTEHQQQWHNH